MNAFVSVFIAVSLDGFIATQDFGVAWLHKYHDPERNEDYGFGAFMANIDVVLMGANTYRSIQDVEPWPYTKPVVVLWAKAVAKRNGVTHASGDVADIIQQLARSGMPRIYIDGGNAIRQALTANCLDRLIINTVPDMLGNGVPLFSDGLPESAWNLEGHKVYSSGLVQAEYVRVRDKS